MAAAIVRAQCMSEIAMNGMSTSAEISARTAVLKDPEIRGGHTDATHQAYVRIERTTAKAHILMGTLKSKAQVNTRAGKTYRGADQILSSLANNTVTQGQPSALKALRMITDERVKSSFDSSYFQSFWDGNWSDQKKLEGEHIMWLTENTKSARIERRCQKPPWKVIARP